MIKMTFGGRAGPPSAMVGEKQTVTTAASTHKEKMKVFMRIGATDKSPEALQQPAST
jgi:hypothetical protein